MSIEMDKSKSQQIEICKNVPMPRRRRNKATNGTDRRQLNHTDMDKAHMDLEKLSARWERRGFCMLDFHLFLMRLSVISLLETEKGPAHTAQFIHDILDETVKLVEEGKVWVEVQVAAGTEVGND